MNFFKKLFKTSTNALSSKEETVNNPSDVFSLDDLFVQNFINKGGKFLYCISQKEALATFHNILKENNWTKISCVDSQLKDICNLTKSPISTSNYDSPFFTNCEHLVADSGNIMLSSNQIREMKLGELDQNFIVFAKTSQMVKNMGEALTGIKINSKGKLPTNICDIRNYSDQQTKENFLNYGVSNTKNLYLILVEDL
ncbi:LUD domain-containing protein [Wenyingzhuangia sp. 1_MG-2023]|nr:LUD domain-containing protein [Wenyingzhuangia sp. 1_MG-2023]